MIKFLGWCKAGELPVASDDMERKWKIKHMIKILNAGSAGGEDASFFTCWNSEQRFISNRNIVLSMKCEIDGCNKEAQYKINWYSSLVKFGANLCEKHLEWVKSDFKLKKVKFEVEQFDSFIESEVVIFN